MEHEACVVREIVANVAAEASLYSQAVRLNDQDEPLPTIGSTVEPLLTHTP